MAFGTSGAGCAREPVSSTPWSQRHGHHDSRPAQRSHEPHPGQGHPPGIGGPLPSSPHGAALPAALAEAPRQARHRAAVAQDSGVRPWVLLAPACEVSLRHDAGEQQGVLAGQIRGEPRTGPAEHSGPPEARVARHRGVGVSGRAFSSRAAPNPVGSAILTQARTGTGTRRDTTRIIVRSRLAASPVPPSGVAVMLLMAPSTENLEIVHGVRTTVLKVLLVM